MATPRDRKPVEAHGGSGSNLKLVTELQALSREAFRTRISGIADDAVLADLRYDFGWDPDPRKSSWQAIEINRLITTRKARRDARPQWIGIVVSALLGLAALLVALLKHEPR